MLDLIVALAVITFLAIYIRGWGPLATHGRWAAGIVIVSSIAGLLTEPPSTIRFRYHAALLLLMCVVGVINFVRPGTRRAR